MKRVIVAGAIAVGILAGCAPAPLPPDPTANQLREHKATQIKGPEITERLAGKTVYGSLSVDTNTARMGDAWIEYFAPDGQLWYRDPRATFHGRWTVPDGKDELCLTFREGEERCAQLFMLEDKIRFVSTAQGPYQGHAASYADRVVDGDVEGFVPKPEEPRRRSRKR